MPKAMSFSSKTLAAALAKGQEISVKIKAIISPYDAANQLVDYSIEWGNAPTHGAEAVTDYVTVAPDSDGSLTATVSCRQAFGDDKIIITVTTLRKPRGGKLFKRAYNGYRLHNAEYFFARRLQGGSRLGGRLRLLKGRRRRQRQIQRQKRNLPLPQRRGKFRRP